MIEEMKQENIRGRGGRGRRGGRRRVRGRARVR